MHNSGLSIFVNFTIKSGLFHVETSRKEEGKNFFFYHIVKWKILRRKLSKELELKPPNYFNKLFFFLSWHPLPMSLASPDNSNSKLYDCFLASLSISCYIFKLSLWPLFFRQFPSKPPWLPHLFALTTFNHLPDFSRYFSLKPLNYLLDLLGFFALKPFNYNINLSG